jgi:hypothetical protein
MFRAFLTAIKSDAVTINIKDMIVTLCLLCQITPASSWVEPMYNSGLFAYLIATLAEGEVRMICRCPKGTTDLPKCGIMLLTEYVYLLARIVLADRAIFLQLMNVTANATGLTEKYLFEGLLDQWWGKVRGIILFSTQHVYIETTSLTV